MFKMYDEPESPHEGAVLRYLNEPKSPNEGGGVFKIYGDSIVTPQ